VEPISGSIFRHLSRQTRSFCYETASSGRQRSLPPPPDSGLPPE
jgi:hypothetical protein